MPSPKNTQKHPKTPKNTQKKEIPKSFRLFTEILAWLQIFISPVLLGAFIGFAVYLSYPTSSGLLIAIVLLVLGFVVGVVWASKQWKGKGTVWFISRIMATPELDREEDSDINN